MGNKVAHPTAVIIRCICYGKKIAYALPLAMLAMTVVGFEWVFRLPEKTSRHSEPAKQVKNLECLNKDSSPTVQNDECRFCISFQAA